MRRSAPRPPAQQFGRQSLRGNSLETDGTCLLSVTAVKTGARGSRYPGSRFHGNDRFLIRENWAAAKNDFFAAASFLRPCGHSEKLLCRSQHPMRVYDELPCRAAVEVAIACRRFVQVDDRNVDGFGYLDLVMQ